VKVAVTGGAGFIGSWVVDELAERGHEPVVFDPRGRTHNDYEFRLGDIRDATAVTELAAHVDAIIHLAAVLGTQETVGNPFPAADTNLMGGLQVLDAAHHYNLPLVNICVGNWWMNNPYSITKNTVERFVSMYRAEWGDQFSNVRCVNAYGPRQAAAPPFGPGKVRKVMPSFTCRALCNLPLEVYGDGHQVSDCVWVGDVARVLVSALETAGDGHPADVEVGPAEPMTVNEIAERVAGVAATLTGQRAPVVHLPMRPGEEPGARVSAVASTCKHVGVDPDTFTPIEVGVAETVRWFWANRGVTWIPTS
jgi:nucleoside-diphosphate-sugar epimerase